MAKSNEILFPCPCCGYLTSSGPGSHDICPICDWEDDLSQLRFPETRGANRVTLVEAQANYVTIGAKASDQQVYVRSASADDARDPWWRPLDPTLDDIKHPIPGVDYGTSYPSDRTELYYWRTKHLRRR